MRDRDRPGEACLTGASHGIDQELPEAVGSHSCATGLH